MSISNDNMEHTYMPHIVWHGVGWLAQPTRTFTTYVQLSLDRLSAKMPNCEENKEKKGFLVVNKTSLETSWEKNYSHPNHRQPKQ